MLCEACSQDEGTVLDNDPCCVPAAWLVVCVTCMDDLDASREHMIRQDLARMALSSPALIAALLLDPRTR